jgi:pilus assembly protein Flp/PilA
MGIDQAGPDQPTGRIDHFMLAGGCEIGADRGDPAVCNEDIGDRRMMDIAVMVVDLPASNQQLFRACHDVQPFLLIAPARRHNLSLGKRILRQRGGATVAPRVAPRDAPSVVLAQRAHSRWRTAMLKYHFTAPLMEPSFIQPNLRFIIHVGGPVHAPQSVDRREESRRGGRFNRPERRKEMRKGVQLIKRLGEDEDGAALVEYTVLLGIMLVAVITTIGLVGGWMSNKWTALWTALQAN